MARSTTEIKRGSVEQVLGGLAHEDHQQSMSAGLKLCREAGEFGLDVRDYLKLAIDVRASNDEKGNNVYRLPNGEFMDGYQASLAALNLPVKNDFKNGVMLQAAADTFSFKPGTRALFPEVIDDIMQWATRQDQLENTAGLIAQSRTIRGNELITEAVFDDQNPNATSPIAELANIPIQTIKSSDRSVRFYKHGSAIRTSYEFERRASLDVLTPYANRIARNLEISKVGMATSLLINGDGVHAAASADAISVYDADLSAGKSLKDNYKALMKFLVNRAKDGIPVDTIVGNFDMYVELFLMFTPTVSNQSLMEALQAQGAPTISLSLPVMKGVTFQLSSSMPAGKLMCYSRGDTLEELVEASANISESEVAIKNQSITYVKTENAGYRLIYGDTRTVLDVTA